ncbi:MAG: DUF2786 domain-containing protein [Deltaproteobacteria bacterium]|nr:DUF2786 domain-containing protein [Deltaproteobacteria bacterium]
MTIPPEILDRVTKLVGMTDSAFDGEALNAIRMANKLLKEHRLSWPQVLQPRPMVSVSTSAISTSRPAPTSGPYTSWLAKIDRIKFCWADLNGWERNFLQGVAGQVGKGRKLTEKQAGILDRLFTQFG